MMPGSVRSQGLLSGHSSISYGSGSRVSRGRCKMITVEKSGHTVAANLLLTVGLRSLLRAGRIISPETFL